MSSNSSYRKIIFSALIISIMALLAYQFLFRPKLLEQKPSVVHVNKTAPKKTVEIITDSKISFEEAISGIDIPDETINSLALIDVEYYSFDGKLHAGQLLINKKNKSDAISIFKEIKENRFPVKSVIPIVKFDWQDEASMEADNSSAFNYRLVKGSTRISSHSLGAAIDINPLENPQFKNGKVSPEGAVYDTTANGAIAPKSVIVKIFKRFGWEWGGQWRTTKDYQHFEKK
jgi:peptidoglycan LD-endopeptidase CwlK